MAICLVMEITTPPRAASSSQPYGCARTCSPDEGRRLNKGLWNHIWIFLTIVAVSTIQNPKAAVVHK
jgi:hypothetical protein